MTLNISTNPKTIASMDTINSPQAYAYKPAAAAYVSDSYYTDKPKSSTLSKVVKTVAAVAVVAGALALCRSKVSALKEININSPEKYKGMQKVKYYLAKSGQFIIDKAKCLKFWGKEAAEGAKEAGEKAAEGAEKAA